MIIQGLGCDDEWQITKSNPDTGRVAIYSRDEKYRYYLEIPLANRKQPTLAGGEKHYSEFFAPCSAPAAPPKTVAFLMLNPSTATENFNDPTVKRCIERSVALGAKHCIITNLFAWRSTDPAALKRVEAPIEQIRSYRNELVLSKVFKQAELVILAWGIHGCVLNRAQDVALAAKVSFEQYVGRKFYCLGYTKPQVMAGKTYRQPRHPLMLAYETKLEIVEWLKILGYDESGVR